MTCTIYILTPPSKLFRIKKAVVVPFNKEIHALLRFSNQLTFEVEGIFDYSGLVRKNRQYFEHIKKENYQLLGWDEIKWETDFDTLIIGHMMQLNELLQHDYLKDFLEKCIKYRNCSGLLFLTHRFFVKTEKIIFLFCLEISMFVDNSGSYLYMKP